jgi:hypothetical protein
MHETPGLISQHSKKRKKLKIELPYNPAILLLGLYPKEFKAGTHIDIYHIHVGSSIICHNQNVEAIQVSISR